MSTPQAEGRQIIVCPADGVAQPIEQAPDIIFAGKLAGDGAVIYLHSGKLFAPADMKILAIFPTKHAIFAETNTGIPLLLHVGVKTQELAGEGIQLLVLDGQSVKSGELLLIIDLHFMERNGIPGVLFLTFTQSPQFYEITWLSRQKKKYSAGEKMLSICKRNPSL